MKIADVTPEVWSRILAIRGGRECRCCGTWAAGEAAALALYGPVADRNAGRCVMAQIGQSLDGRIATQSGDARDVSGQDGLAHLHRLRALVDAVIIGVRTALHDQPRLTVRLVPGTSPARVVIDPAGRLPDDAPVLADDGARRLVIQTVERRRPRGVEVVRLPAAGRWIAPHQIVEALAGRGLRHLLIEGGSITIAQFLEAQLLTRLHVAVAPLIIGAGPQGLTTQPVDSLSQAIRPATEVYGLGTDVLFDCTLQEAAAMARCAEVA